MVSSLVRAQSGPSQVTSPHLYVFDCGVLVRGEPLAYNLTTAQVGGNTNFSDACFLIVHPKERSSGMWASSLTRRSNQVASKFPPVAAETRTRHPRRSRASWRKSVSNPKTSH